MAPPLLGVETEYALTAFDIGGNRVDPEQAAVTLIAIARGRLPCLPDRGSSCGVFLANASRLYRDCGNHPEWSTGECSNPFELTRHILAGERMLEHLATEWVSGCGIGHPVSQAWIRKNNVDYHSLVTWGCHESYSTGCRRFSSIPHQILPFLATRPIYTGAGGFDSRAPGIVFSLSPRATHIVKVGSPSSTESRGLLHQKDESLGRGGKRLHVLCGEALCSQTGMVLRSGCTALVVALANAGVAVGDPVELAAPLKALHRVASDVSCRAELLLANGSTTTALMIQRHYLAEARAHRHRLPPWSDEICDLWDTALTRLETEGAPGLAATLDWPLKHALFTDRLHRHGMSWSMVGRWNSVLRVLERILRCRFDVMGPVSGDFLRNATGPIGAVVAKLGSALESRHLAWSGLDRFLEVRSELFEIDTRFSVLGPSGIFNALDQAGVLSHRVAAVGDVVNAVEQPPEIGRAHLRGECIRRLVQSRVAASCDWTSIWDDSTRRVLDLSDPWETEERWAPCAAS